VDTTKTVHRNLIGGEWCEPADAIRNINPSDTRETVGLYARGDAADAQRAVEAARAAFPVWADSSPQLRHDILARAAQELLARKEELGRLLSSEEGKTLPEGMGEVARAASVLAFMAGEALRIRGDRLPGLQPGSDAEVTREPLGVVGVIAPWNFPIAIPAWKIAPALAYGNTVVFKPAELVPASAWALVDVLHRAGLPDGVLNLVMGSGSQIGGVLCSHPQVDAISFTGSVPTGRRLRGRPAHEAHAARDGRQESTDRPG
jgi:aldehyde dehydrogenase (NAD+)